MRSRVRCYFFNEVRKLENLRNDIIIFCALFLQGELAPAALQPAARFSTTRTLKVCIQYNPGCGTAIGRCGTPRSGTVRCGAARCGTARCGTAICAAQLQVRHS